MLTELTMSTEIWMLILGNKSLTNFLGRKIIEKYIYFNKKRRRILVIPDCSGHPSVCPQDAQESFSEGRNTSLVYPVRDALSIFQCGLEFSNKEVYNSYASDYSKFFFQPDHLLFSCLLASQQC